MRDWLIGIGVAGGIGWLTQQLWIIGRELWWRLEDWWWAGYDTIDAEEELPGNDGAWYLDIFADNAMVSGSRGDD